MSPSLTPPGISDERRRTLADIEAPMRELLEEARSCDLHALERAEAAELLHELRPRVLQLLERCAALVSPSDPGGEIESGVYPAIEESGAHAGTLYVIGLELRQKARLIGEFPEAGSMWSLLAHCASALRHVIRAACEVLNTLQRARGAPPIEHPGDDLETSLRTRRGYARLRAVVSAPLQLDDPDRLAQRLLSCANAIAVVTTGRGAHDLRVDDRIQLRALRDRIRAWLIDRPMDQGAQLVSELRAYCELLRAVSRREVLVDHDRIVLAGAAARLADPARLDAEFLRQVAPLRGRDATLDALILRASTDRDVWRTALRQLGRLDDACRW